MGAWGTGFFENDDALDWISELEDTGHDAIQSALMVADEEEIEAPDASCAVAAAVIVLAMAGSTFKALPEEVDAWLEENAERPESALLERALEAVRAVRESSELREVWEETDDYAEWDRLMRKLVDKLEAKVG